MKRIIQFSLLLLLCLPLTALAELPEQLKADFAPISGVIIMPIGEEYLVDLDASANLREGDILTLVTPGEKVIHPVTKDVLGSIDRPKGFLQVTRLKSGYSYAKLLFAATPPENGEQIKRFEQVPASFSSATANEKLFNDLKTGLPQFKWLSPGETAEALVTFTLSQNILTVKNSSGTTLKSYQYINDQLVAAKTTASSSSVFQVDADPSRNNRSFLNKSVNTLLDTVGLGSSKGRAGIIRSPEAQKRMGIWMGPSLSGNPVGIAVADLDNDGRQETAIAMETYLLITQIAQGKMVEEGRIDL
ncbi:MAG: hypothetical protein GQ578_07435, partial [Desulfuromonadaceae bacterium]|nr:hypothetical protein [Desulfuromonadaceae bacterium]